MSQQRCLACHVNVDAGREPNHEQSEKHRQALADYLAARRGPIQRERRRARMQTAAAAVVAFLAGIVMTAALGGHV